MQKFKPSNQFQQWVVDNISYIENQFTNHLKHHATITLSLLLPILIGVILLLIKLFLFAQIKP